MSDQTKNKDWAQPGLATMIGSITAKEINEMTREQEQALVRGFKASQAIKKPAFHRFLIRLFLVLFVQERGSK